MKVQNPLGKEYKDLILPDNTFIAHMKDPEVLKDPKNAIVKSLENPIGSESLMVIAKGKKKDKANAKAVIVVSDNTRPVPYKGESGILLPIIDILMSSGYNKDQITVLVATGMHRPMTEDELRFMIDQKVFDLGIKVINHEPKNNDRLVLIGRTGRGTNVTIDSLYMEADLKITTGLVESHFMAGASGGRKSICPGVIGEESTFIFHGPELMGSPDSRDLLIEGNPVHEESLEVAKMAGVDFICNVTLDHSFKITGVFSGDLEKAHEAAVAKIRETVEVPVPQKADIVITHGGFVGINHYQVAKCGVASIGALKEGGYLISIADCKDKGHVIGSVNYRVTLTLLKLLGPEKFVKLLKSQDWVFLPEQWQVQMWARVFRVIDQNNFYFYAPQIGSSWYDSIPGIDVRALGSVNDSCDDYNNVLELAIKDIEKRTGKNRKDLTITFLQEGPYEIPVAR